MPKLSNAVHPKRRERIGRIVASLEQSYGPHPWPAPARTCLDVFVRAMLAQNTLLANARSGYRQLRRRFRSWTEVMEAGRYEVQRQIAVCGLARMRAYRLQAILRQIKREHGRLDLQHLGQLEPQQAYEYLLGFHGIGPKTAAMTLLFAFGMPLFPVDNGIHRMARRLRLVRPKAGHEETSQTIRRHVPEPSMCYPLHVLMFTHAKDVCRPRNPRCDACVLVDTCPYGKARLRHRPPDVELSIVESRMKPVILSRSAASGIPKNGASKRTPPTTDAPEEHAHAPRPAAPGRRTG